MELLPTPFAMRGLQERGWLSAMGIPRCNGLALDQRITRPQRAVAEGHFVQVGLHPPMWSEPLGLLRRRQAVRTGARLFRWRAARCHLLSLGGCKSMKTW